MAMFDSIYVECPYCGHKLEMQSYAGPCVQNDYTLSTAPQEILLDLDFNTIRCYAGCKKLVVVHTFVSAQATIVKDYEQHPTWGEIKDGME